MKVKFISMSRAQVFGDKRWTEMSLCGQDVRCWGDKYQCLVF